MRNIEDLEKDLKKLQEEINQLKENKKKNVRWRANYNETYYTLFGDGDVLNTDETNSIDDKQRYDIGNYFKTKEEAEKAVEKLKIYTQLKDLALRLNNREKIDWENFKQRKFSIYYDNYVKKIYRDSNITCKALGLIYCLDENFKDKAIEEIGEENLLKLFEED